MFTTAIYHSVSKRDCGNGLNKIYHFNPLPDKTILDWFNLKQFADDNFKLDENSRKFCKRVENTVGKGEIARHEQFLLFPQCFQKACFPGASKGVIEWEWIKREKKLFTNISFFPKMFSIAIVLRIVRT